MFLQGALSGMASAAFATVWVFVGRMAYPVPPHFTNRLPLSTSECDSWPVNNQTTLTSNYSSYEITIDVSTTSHVTMLATTASTVAERPPVADLYAISYIYLTAFGFCFGMVVGIVVSLATGAS